MLRRYSFHLVGPSPSSNAWLPPYLRRPARSLARWRAHLGTSGGLASSGWNPWIIVDIGERDWSRLAYQFHHELGHVTTNSWRADAWFEEALVEAFSLRGLALLANSWSTSPPFKDDSGFGAAVTVYRQNIVER
jgi:hypothetical protein